MTHTEYEHKGVGILARDIWIGRTDGPEHIFAIGRESYSIKGVSEGDESPLLTIDLVIHADGRIHLTKNKTDENVLIRLFKIKGTLTSEEISSSHLSEVTEL